MGGGAAVVRVEPSWCSPARVALVLAAGVAVGCQDRARAAAPDASADAADVGVDVDVDASEDVGVVDDRDILRDVGPRPPLSGTCASGQWCLEWPTVSLGGLAGAHVWRDGRAIAVTASGFVSTFDGERWSRRAFDPSPSIVGLWAGDDGEVRLTARSPVDDSAQLLRVDARGLDPVGNVLPSGFGAVVGPGATRLYGTDGIELRRWDGQRWSRVPGEFPGSQGRLIWDGAGVVFMDRGGRLRRYLDREERAEDLGIVPGELPTLLAYVRVRDRPWLLVNQVFGDEPVLFRSPFVGEPSWTRVQAPTGGVRAIAAVGETLVVANGVGCWRIAAEPPFDVTWTRLSAPCAVDDGQLVAVGDRLWAFGDRWARGGLDGVWTTWDDGRARTVPSFARGLGDAPTIALSSPFALLRRSDEGWRRGPPFPAFVDPRLAPTRWADLPGGGGVAWLSSRVMIVDRALELRHFASPPFEAPTSIALHPDGRLFGTLRAQLVVTDGRRITLMPSPASGAVAGVFVELVSVHVTDRGTLLVGARDPATGQGWLARRDEQTWTAITEPTLLARGTPLVAGTDDALWMQVAGVELQTPLGATRFPDAPVLAALEVEADGRATGVAYQGIASFDARSGRTTFVPLPSALVGRVTGALWPRADELYVISTDHQLFRYTP